MTSQNEAQVAVRVNGINKTFKLPQEKHTSLKSAFIHLFGGSRRYLVQRALREISFEVKKGEFFGVVGRNGSGKSTLLKIIASIYQPTSGKLEVRGKLVPFIELGVGFNPELTGRENVYLNGALLGFSTKEIDAKYKDIVEFAELEKFMDQKLKNYSSGMQVRLAFSMAVRAEADILLIDEVLAVGDAAFQRKCFEYFNQLKHNGKTVIFVSHDMDAVRKYCDRAVILEDGKIMQIGPTREVAQAYLKLFTAEDKQNKKETTGKRWGNGSWKTDSISVRVSDKTIVINQKIRAKTSTEPPIVGIRIRATSGQDVTGTNSLIEGVTVPEGKKGLLLNLEWTLPNIFSDGKYYVDSAIAEDDGTTMADWWDEAGGFTIKKNRPLPYNVDPDFKLTVKVM